MSKRSLNHRIDDAFCKLWKRRTELESELCNDPEYRSLENAYSTTLHECRERERQVEADQQHVAMPVIVRAMRPMKRVITSVRGLAAKDFPSAAIECDPWFVNYRRLGWFPRSSEYPAFTRDHCARGRPSARSVSMLSRCGQPTGDSSHVSCRP